ncbi:MAG: hypothetical protein RML45_06740 [Acetobacteraceae bacterium]|nr:hypothetical protein [Acetobacteraceae bacterium]
MPRAGVQSRLSVIQPKNKKAVARTGIASRRIPSRQTIHAAKGKPAAKNSTVSSIGNLGKKYLMLLE